MSCESDILKFAKKTNRKVETVRRGVIISLFAGIIKDTPRDKGMLVANWQMSNDAPAGGIISIQDQGGQDTLWKLMNFNFKSSSDAYLTNNLPYAVVAEHGLWEGAPSEKLTSAGFSKKAPAGMVAINMLRIQKNFASEVKKLTKGDN